jgi:hypothetical protein
MSMKAGNGVSSQCSNHFLPSLVYMLESPLNSTPLEKETIMPLSKFLRWQTTNGPPIRLGDATVTPQAQALIVRLPYGGFVWNRPVAVLVERKGKMQRIPVVDVTHLAIILLAFSAIVGVILFKKEQNP